MIYVRPSLFIFTKSYASEQGNMSFMHRQFIILEGSMDLLIRETDFKNIYRKVFRKVGAGNYRYLSYRNRFQLAKPQRVGQKLLIENQYVPLGKSQKLCELQSGPYLVTQVIMEVRYKIAIGADPTRTQVVHRNHLVEHFPPDNELPNLLSNYEKLFNDDETVHFYNEYAKN